MQDYTFKCGFVVVRLHVPFVCLPSVVAVCCLVGVAYAVITVQLYQ